MQKSLPEGYCRYPKTATKITMCGGINSIYRREKENLTLEINPSFCLPN